MNRNKSNKISKKQTYKNKYVNKINKKTSKYKITKTKSLRKKKTNQFKKTKKIKGGNLPKYRIRNPVSELKLYSIKEPLKVYFVSYKSKITDDRNDYEYLVKIPNDWKHHIQKYRDNENYMDIHNDIIRNLFFKIKKDIETGYMSLNDIEQISEYIDNNHISKDILKMWEKSAENLHYNLENGRDERDTNFLLDKNINDLNEHNKKLDDAVLTFTNKSKIPRADRNISKYIPKIIERYYAPPGIYNKDGGPGYISSKKNFNTLQN